MKPTSKHLCEAGCCEVSASTCSCGLYAPPRPPPLPEHMHPSHTPEWRQHRAPTPSSSHGTCSTPVADRAALSCYVHLSLQGMIARLSNTRHTESCTKKKNWNSQMCRPSTVPAPYRRSQANPGSPPQILCLSGQETLHSSRILVLWLQDPAPPPASRMQHLWHVQKKQQAVADAYIITITQRDWQEVGAP